MSLRPAEIDHPILSHGGLANSRQGRIRAFSSRASLYRTSPLKSDATVLLWGEIPGQKPEPVAWVREHSTGEEAARVAYIGLGHPSDMERAGFLQLLRRTVDWCLDLPAADLRTFGGGAQEYRNVWREVSVPGSWKESDAVLGGVDGFVSYRIAVRLPAAWAANDIRLDLGQADDADQTYWDGLKIGQTGSPSLRQLPSSDHSAKTSREYVIPAARIRAGEWHVLRVDMVDCGGPGGLLGNDAQPQILGPEGSRLSLRGKWQIRVGDAKTQGRFVPRDRDTADAIPAAFRYGLQSRERP